MLDRFTLVSPRGPRRGAVLQAAPRLLRNPTMPIRSLLSETSFKPDQTEVIAKASMTHAIRRARLRVEQPAARSFPERRPPASAILTWFKVADARKAPKGKGPGTYP